MDADDYPDIVTLRRSNRIAMDSNERTFRVPYMVEVEYHSGAPKGIEYIQIREYIRLLAKIRQLEKELAECYADDRRKNED